MLIQSWGGDVAAKRLPFDNTPHHLVFGWSIFPKSFVMFSTRTSPRTLLAAGFVAAVALPGCPSPSI
jgi:hypothetical protein